MLEIVALFSLAIAVLGGYGVIAPSGLLALVRGIRPGSVLWLGFAVRLGFAVALWLAAPASHTPAAFRVLAVIALLAAVALPALGAVRLARQVAWWVRQPAWRVRLACFATLAFGLFTLWSSVLGLRAG